MIPRNDGYAGVKGTLQPGVYWLIDFSSRRWMRWSHETLHLEWID